MVALSRRLVACIEQVLRGALRMLRARQGLGMLLLALAMIPVTGQAACAKLEPDTLWNYDGVLGKGLRVRMTLVFGSDQVSGVYFYASQMRDIPLRGQIRNGTTLVLDELDAAGKAVARFEGSFAEQDPRGRFAGSALECEVMVGTWQQLGLSNPPNPLPFYLSFDSSTGGSLTQRYAAAGATDDEAIHRRAALFREAVQRADKKTVASLVAYPVRVQLAAGPKRLRNATELMANYDAIFSAPYRAAIAKALPRNMFVRDQGIMLGKGEVWFGADGKVIALNNY